MAGYLGSARRMTSVPCQIFGVSSGMYIGEQCFQPCLSLDSKCGGGGGVFLRNSGKMPSSAVAFPAFVSEAALFTSSTVKGNDGGDETGSDLIACQSPLHTLHLIDLSSGTFDS